MCVCVLVPVYVRACPHVVVWRGEAMGVMLAPNFKLCKECWCVAVLHS